MNIIKFKNISIHNFKSIGDEVTFNYDDLPGMTYVIGENKDIPALRNGVGKSVIFVDALLMVLFGEVSNKVKNQSLFHRSAKSNVGWIKLQMDVNDQEWNVHCVLTRSKSGNVSLTRDIYKGCVSEENSATKSSIAETMKFLADEVIKSDADTFKNAVILSTSNIQNFFTLPKPAKDAYLDSVFMLAAFGEVFTNVKKHLNQLKKELSSQREVMEELKRSHDAIIQKSDAFIKEKQTELALIDLKIKTKTIEIKELQSKIVDITSIEELIASKQLEVKSNIKKLNVLTEERNSISNGDEEVPGKLEQYSIKVNKELDKALNNNKECIDKLTNEINEINKGILILEEKKNEIILSNIEHNKTIDFIKGEVIPLENNLKDISAELMAMIEIKSQFAETYEMLCDSCQRATKDHFKFDQDRYNKLENANNKLNELIKQKQFDINEILLIYNANNELKNQYDSDIIKNNNKIKELDKQVKTIEENNTKAQSVIKDDIAKYERGLYDAARNEYKKIIASNLDQCNQLNEHIDNLKDSIRDLEQEIKDVNSLTIRIQDQSLILKQFVDQYKNINSKVNPFDSLVVDGQNKIDAAKEVIQTILSDVRKFEILSNIFCEEGVKKHIVSNIVASLNVIIKKYLNEMGSSYTVIFDDKFQYNFYTETGESEYGLFSSGERRRLDMAVMLALRDILFTNGLITNILIVDEVLDSGIDGYALFAVLNILKNKTKESNLGCMVISHRTEILEDISDLFDRVITVVKENNQSSILTD